MKAYCVAMEAALISCNTPADFTVLSIRWTRRAFRWNSSRIVQSYCLQCAAIFELGRLAMEARLAGNISLAMSHEQRLQNRLNVIASRARIGA